MNGRQGVGTQDGDAGKGLFARQPGRTAACGAGKIADRAGNDGDTMPLPGKLLRHFDMPGAASFVQSRKSLMNQQDVHGGNCILF